jgi:hypothetical protein
MLSCSLFVESVVDMPEKHVFQIVEQLTGDTLDTSQLQMLYSMYKHPFKSIDTMYKQIKYCKEKGYLVEPQQYVIGSRAGYRPDKSTGAVVPQMEDVTGQFISVKQMLQAYLRDPCKAMQAVSCPLPHKDCLKSYFDGNKWRQQNLQGDRIVLRFYGDDFEPANPLGSRKGVYKIGCIYYQCEGMPTEMLSKVDNTLLALCYHTDDVRDFGWGKVLHYLLAELQQLEREGVELIFYWETFYIPRGNQLHHWR